MKIFFNETNGTLCLNCEIGINGIGATVSTDGDIVHIHEAEIIDRAAFSAPYTEVTDSFDVGFASLIDCTNYIEAEIEKCNQFIRNLAIPTATINPFTAATIPTGFLLCDGAAISRTDYAALFAVIGTNYGVGDGSTTFNLPDLRGRYAFGKSVSGTGSSLGDTFGTIDHTHTIPSLGGTTSTNGAHNHGGITGDANSGSNKFLLSILGDPAADFPSHQHSISEDGDHSHTVSTTASNTGEENPPSLSLNFIIKT